MSERESKLKKITVLMGSPHKGGATSAAVRRFLEGLESFGDVQSEIVALSDYDIRTCRGCKACFKSGEERCPLHDDRDVLIEKIAASDGIVFASPNYSFQVSAIMKIFLDRLGYLFHRPSFHGKTSTAIVVFGIYGARKIAKYLDFVGGGLGFHVVKGSCIRTLEPMTEKARVRMDRTLAKQGRRFHARLSRPIHTAPPLIGLLAFRIGRTRIRLMLGEADRDYIYYREHGWFESDFYYPTRLGPFKKAAGALFDRVAARLFKPPVARPRGEVADPGRTI
jgi:multimeric flavodoxin WrbA